MSKLNIKKCILVGNSLGGQIAWHYALMYPSKVEKLVLIDAAGLRFTSSKPPLAFRLARIPILNQLLTKITPRSVVRKSIEDVYSDKSLITDNLIDRYLELALRKGNRQAMVVRLTTTIDYNKIPDLQKMYMPTLILWGNDDKLIPVSSASEFSTLIPNDTMVIIPNCGHVPMEECPVKSLQALRSFLRI
ncbi:MAG: alpha/beta hydrolase [Saprospiraceae bacterium]|nr:alpha/beta hydrolase [Saprospiraceae bacterium]